MIEEESKKIILCDIDGTISKIGDRLKFIIGEHKDWDSFYSDSFDDELIIEIVDLVKTLVDSQKYRIVFCTGRSSICREKTEQWISKNLLLDKSEICLLMRKNGDHRPDHVIKKSLISEANIKFEDISFVLEDRQEVVNMWRENKVRCLQVDKGNF